MRYFIFDSRVTALDSCCILNDESVERACALRSVTAMLVSKGSPFWDRCLLQVERTARIDFPVNWIRVMGF